MALNENFDGSLKNNLILCVSRRGNQIFRNNQMEEERAN